MSASKNRPGMGPTRSAYRLTEGERIDAVMRAAEQVHKYGAFESRLTDAQIRAVQPKSKKRKLPQRERNGESK
jgi:hypothetical protein